MMITPHTIVGAAAGAAIGSPGLAFLAGFILHHILDALPHVDLNNLYNTDTKDRRYSWLDYLVIGIDGLVALTVLWVFSSSTIHPAAFWWGALGGITPDLIDNHPWRFTSRQWPILKQYHWFHHKVHCSTGTESRLFWLGMTVEILVMVGGIIWLGK